MSFATAADRIRSDFNEMPGLELTIGQGIRLWNLGADDCRNVLDALVDAGYVVDYGKSPAPAGAEPASLGPRVPGSWLRLGSTEGQVLARGAFPVVPGVRGFVTREGATSWFGLPSTATLKFRADLLSRAEFVVEDVKSEITREIPLYKWKKKLMLAIHRIEIREI